MLVNIDISNLAIVKAQRISFPRGLTVMTGETGAGKSLILDGLGLIMGDRADSGIVSTGAKRAEVTAEFDISRLTDARSWLAQRDLDDPDEPELVTVRRTVTVEGRSKAYVNNRPVTLSDLRQLAAHLVHLQGQHATYALLNHERQRDLLDRFGELSQAKNNVRVHFQKHAALKKQLKEVRDRVDENQAKRDLLEYQVNELADLAMQPNEWDSLSSRVKNLGSSDDQKQILVDATHKLSSDNDGAINLLRSIESQLTKLTEDRPDLSAALQLASEALINVDELNNELLDATERTESDPAALAELEQRLSRWLDLSRKHRVEPNQLEALQSGLLNELDNINLDQSSLPDLIDATDQAEAALTQACAALTQYRHEAASRLVVGVNSLLSELAMSDAELSYDISLKPNGPEGADEFQLVLRSNLGQKAQSLSKVASGGELSRIALAIQVIVAEALQTPTLIFDEVDVGIGGQTAAKVGDLLLQLAKHSQILTVTHQPQVASAGQSHLHVSKASDTDQTVSKIEMLNPTQRVEEVARMLGGKAVTTSTREAAKEMLMSH